MTVNELYEVIEGDYEGLIERLGSDRLVNTLLKLFSQDVNMSELEAGMDAENYDAAFRAAHGLKGLCANLAIVKLGNLASGITECLRNESDIDRAKEVFVLVKEEYTRVTKAIEEYTSA